MKFKKLSFGGSRRYEAANSSASAGRCASGDSLYKNYDRGNMPTVLNIGEVSRENENYRTAIWTGENLQLTVMSIPVGSDIGGEIHTDTDQFIGIESGVAEVVMGRDENDIRVRETVSGKGAIIVPRNTWHNIINAGRVPLKLYSLYAPPHHPYGTVQKEKE